MTPSPIARPLHPSEIALLAELWFDGWQDAHARILPAELVRERTRARFEERLAAAAGQVRVIGRVGEPQGFHLLEGDELNQLYVLAASRGKGIAVALLADAHAVLVARGFEKAWLACAIGNERAARFYEKSGWRRTGVVEVSLELPGRDAFALDVWRYEKALLA